MKILLYLGTAVVSYLIGGLNPAILLSKAVYHQDIRRQGSGNPGFTNFKRVYGNKWAWYVFALDIGKAALLVWTAGALFGLMGMGQLGAAYAGFFVMVGHAYPVWYGFKGGKGFLVGAATLFFVDWRAGLIALAVMMLLLFSAKYMSLSVLCAGLSCLISLPLLGTSLPVCILSALSVLLMTWRHRENIRRLIRGTEPKFSLRSK